MGNTQWISDFLRQSLLSGRDWDTIYQWSQALIEHLEEEKPDQEVHLFGVSRIQRMPSFLLASTAESFPEKIPHRVQVTEKTADLFLAPTEGSIRMLSEELPMSVIYEMNDSGEEDARRELNFYEAICFDAGESSIIFGLILNDTPLEEYLSSEEIAELLPLIRTQAVPLFERFLYRQAFERLEKEIDVMAGMVRESTAGTPTVASGPTSAPAPSANATARSMMDNLLNPHFFHYVSQEVRDAVEDVLTCEEIQYELSQLGSVSPGGKAPQLQTAVDHLQGLMRNLSNISALMQPNVVPQTTSFSMQKFMQDLHTAAGAVSSRHRVKLHADPHVRNFFARGDQDTLLRLLERLMEFNFAQARGKQAWVRMETSARRVDKGQLMIEIEDEGEIPLGVPLGSLLQRMKDHAESHPRLQQGGGLLLLLIDLFLQRSGGKLKLDLGLNSCYTVQIILPMVSRSEMERGRTSQQEAITHF